VGAVRRFLRTALPELLIGFVAALAWMVFTGSRALAAIGDVRTAAEDVRTAVDGADLPALQIAAADASEAAVRANNALDDPVWAVAAAIRYLGDMAEVARVTTSAIAAAADGIQPLLEVSDVLEPARSERPHAPDRTASDTHDRDRVEHRQGGGLDHSVDELQRTVRQHEQIHDHRQRHRHRCARRCPRHRLGRDTARPGLSWLGESTARLVGRVWAAAETWLRSTAARMAAPVRDGVRWFGDVLTGTGIVAESLARTPLVRSVSTTGAKVAAGVLAVHAVSKGAVAAKIVAALPASMDAIVLLTNPWAALAGVGVATAVAMTIALARLLAAGSDDGPDDAALRP